MIGWKRGRKLASVCLLVKLPGASVLNMRLVNARKSPLCNYCTCSENLQRVQRPSQILTWKHWQNHWQLVSRNPETTRKSYFFLRVLVCPFAWREREREEPTDLSFPAQICLRLCYPSVLSSWSPSLGSCIQVWWNSQSTPQRSVQS